jgi:hypothetical protein
MYKSFKYKNIRCLLQEKHTNLCGRNRKVVYKYEGIGLTKGVYNSSKHMNKKIEYMLYAVKVDGPKKKNP